MPKVSVIIPSYNVEAYIESSLQSVLAQTFKDFEVLVINDGSSDRTVELASAVAAADARVRVITQVNRGLAGARNGGIRAARGEYLAFLDADDLWRADKLERHVQHLDSRPAVGVSYCPSAFINQEGEPMGLLQAPALHAISAAQIFQRNPVGNGSAPVIRRETLNDIAYPAPTGTPGELWYFDETFKQSEDIECWVRIALTTRWGFEGLSEALTLYRVNAGGLSANLGRQLESWERMVAKASIYAPDFVKRWGGPARGYQLRYLARRAVCMDDAGGAARLLLRGLRSHPAMLWQEPARTWSTLAAVAVQSVVPAQTYRWLQAQGMRWAGQLQRKQLPV